ESACWMEIVCRGSGEGVWKKFYLDCVLKSFYSEKKRKVVSLEDGIEEKVDYLTSLFSGRESKVLDILFTRVSELPAMDILLDKLDKESSKETEEESDSKCN